MTISNFNNENEFNSLNYNISYNDYENYSYEKKDKPNEVQIEIEQIPEDQISILTKSATDLDLDSRENNDNQFNFKKINYNRLKDHYELELKDINWRLDKRSEYASNTMILLFMQNFALFLFLLYMMQHNRISEYSILFPTITTATLVETGYLIRKIFELVFKEITYVKYDDSNNN